MAGVNKVILLGNLGNDPDMRYMPNGEPVANISIATSANWTDKNTGEKREKTEWHRVVAYRRTAEIIGQYCKKGDKLYIEGRLQTRNWNDQDGKTRYMTEVIAESIQLLGGRGQAAGKTNSHKVREADMATMRWRTGKAGNPSNHPIRAIRHHLRRISHHRMIMAITRTV